MINAINNQKIYLGPNQISFSANNKHQDKKISFGETLDSFESSKEDDSLCPDNPMLSSIRNYIRTQLMTNSGIIEPEDRQDIVKHIKTSPKSPSSDSDILGELIQAKVSYPDKRADNLYSGGRLDAAYVGENVADILKKRGITHIIYLKQEDLDRYRQFADKNGFNFVEPPNFLVSLALDFDFDISQEEPIISDSFVQYMTKLNDVVSNNVCYIGCEYGISKTYQILYYLSALNDDIKLPNMNITDEMKSNFEYLKQFKK